MTDHPHDVPEEFSELHNTMGEADDVSLPEDMAPSEDGIDLDCPDDYAPPPPSPEGSGPDADSPPDPLALSAQEPMNDVGNGRRFIHHFGDDICHVSQVGWHIWDGTRWKGDEMITKEMAPEIRKLAQQMGPLIEKEIAHIEITPRDRQLLDDRIALRKRRAEIEAVAGYADDEALTAELRQIDSRLIGIEGALKKHEAKIARRLTHAKNAGNTRIMNNMVNEAMVMRSQPVSRMDQGALLINTLSGVLRFYREQVDEAGVDGPPELVEVSKVELMPHDRDQMLTKIAPVEYDPAATCPRFDAFLTQIQPNIVMRQFLQRWFGLSMTGLDVQKLAFFHGGGANGKSVLVDLMSRIAGDYAATAKIESLTGKNKKSGSDSQPDLIPLIAARMVSTSEPEEGERLQEGLVKALTGGEPMMIRDLFSGMITFRPIFKMTISGNHLPEIRGGDDGIWRRVMLVKFPIQIPAHKRIDKSELDEILWAERSGILNWLVEGILNYMQTGLDEPEEVRMATKEFRGMSDPVASFLADVTMVTGYEGDFMTSRALIEAFNFWLEEQGLSRWGGRTVSNRLRDKSDSWRHPETGKTFTPRKSGVTGYGGIHLIDSFLARMREAENSDWGPR